MYSPRVSQVSIPFSRMRRRYESRVLTGIPLLAASSTARWRVNPVLLIVLAGAAGFLFF